MTDGAFARLFDTLPKTGQKKKKHGEATPGRRAAVIIKRLLNLDEATVDAVLGTPVHKESDASSHPAPPRPAPRNEVAKVTKCVFALQRI